MATKKNKAETTAAVKEKSARGKKLPTEQRDYEVGNKKPPVTDNDIVKLEKIAAREELILESKDRFLNQGTIAPMPVFSDSEDKADTQILLLKMALRNPDNHSELFGEILGDLVAGAYQDRCNLYCQTLKENTGDGYNRLLKLRQSADNHLLNVLRAVRDIKRPPVQVVVQQAETVNVAGQVNQGEQQVNIAKNEQLPK